MAALQFAPILLFGAYGGMLADRIPKRTLLQLTQLAMAVPALALFALYAGGIVEPWMVFLLVFARGTVNALDNPARQSFVIEMVGPERVVNAVSLNSVIVHTARIAGPAVAGAVISLWGVGPCFLLNAVSFGAMVVALRGMDARQLADVPPASGGRGALRAALRYVRATPALRVPLLMMALVGTLSFNFLVVLPLLARFTFDAPASGYAWLMSAMGVGSVIGALAAGARGRVDDRLLIRSAAAFGALILVLSLAPTLHVAALALVPLGAASVTFAAGVNSSLQLAVTPEMRGRVMALYSIVFLGTTPIGGPLSGWLAETWSPRLALVVGGAAALIAAAGAQLALTRANPSDPRPGRGPKLGRPGVRRSGRPGSSRPSRRSRSSHSGSSRGTAGDSPRRSRRAPPVRPRS